MLLSCWQLGQILWKRDLVRFHSNRMSLFHSILRLGGKLSLRTYDEGAFAINCDSCADNPCLKWLVVLWHEYIFLVCSWKVWIFISGASIAWIHTWFLKYSSTCVVLICDFALRPKECTALPAPWGDWVGQSEPSASPHVAGASCVVARWEPACSGHSCPLLWKALQCTIVLQPGSHICCRRWCLPSSIALYFGHMTCFCALVFEQKLLFEVPVAQLSISQHGLRSEQICVEAWGIYLRPTELDAVIPAIPPSPPIHVYLSSW